MLQKLLLLKVFFKQCFLIVFMKQTLIDDFSGLRKNKNCAFPLKECKYIEKKVVRYIHDNLSNFSYSSDDSDEEQIKAIRLMIFENIFFDGAIF